jgi:hypothetical protein
MTTSSALDERSTKKPFARTFDQRSRSLWNPCSMSVVASGRTVDADSWQLRVSTDPETGRVVTIVDVQLADGTAVWGGGCGGTVPPIRQVDTYWGAAESGPRTFLARVTADVRAVVVTLSDGTREDLVLHRVPEHGALRVGVLVYPRVLDVHRVDVLDADGRPLPVEP